MYFLNVNILAAQLLPPSWRNGKLMFLKSCLKPFSVVLDDFEQFRINAKSKVNLSPQTMVVENHLRRITGINYGIYIANTSQPNEFKVYLPAAAETQLNEITVFMKKIIPAGRKYEFIFY